MSDDHLLPPEIWYEILTKLPVKPFLRCKSVCKTWYSLISSPNFISYHTTQTLNQSTGDRVLVHCRRFGSDLSKFSFLNKSFVESHDHHDVPQPLRRPELDIVGSCHGLICLRERDIKHSYRVDRFMIWNPSIRKLVELPLLYTSPQAKEISHVLGFGFDSESRDYKAVRVVYYNTLGSTSNDVVVAECDVLDLKSPDWRSSSFPMHPTFFSKKPCVYLHGNLHWTGIEYDKIFPNDVLVSFNLSSEVLQEMGTLPGAERDEYGEIGSYTILYPINGLLSASNKVLFVNIAFHFGR